MYTYMFVHRGEESYTKDGHFSGFVLADNNLSHPDFWKAKKITLELHLDCYSTVQLSE